MVDCVRTNTGVLTKQLRCGCENVDPTVNPDCVGTGTVLDEITSPIVCSTCDSLGTGSPPELPVPCAFQAIRLCPKNNSVDLLCVKNSVVYDLNAWVTEKIVFRPACSNSGPSSDCIYYALRPLTFFAGSPWFGQSGLQYEKIGPDWSDIAGLNPCTTHRPCSWSDRTYSSTIGIPLWTDCNGSGGATVCLPLSKNYCITAGENPVNDPLCSFALKLDPIAGRITTTGFFRDVGLPDFPSYTLKEGTTWNCHGCNIFIKDEVGTGTSVGTGEFDQDRWGMPTMIEVVPLIEDARIACQSMDFSTCIDGDDLKADPNCDYPTKESRSKCCDPCCDCIPGFININCGGTVQSCSGSYCKGGRTGVDGPAGPSRELCCDFTIDGDTYEICTVIYCKADGTWKGDSYCDGVFCGTFDITLSSCCPIAGSGSFDICCPGLNCSGCVGVNENCDPPPDPCCCSVLSGGLTADIQTSGCSSVGNQTVTLDESPNCPIWEKELSVGSGNASLKLECSGGSWTATLTCTFSGMTGTGILTDTVASVDCNAFDLSFSFNTADDPGGWDAYCGGNLTITVDVTV